LERALQFALNAGYTGWEVAPFMLGTDATTITPQQRREYRQTVTRSGLEIIGLHWLLAKTSGYHVTTPDPEIRTRTSGYLIELVRLCADLGGQLMVFGSPLQRNIPEGVSMEAAMQNAADVLERVVPALEGAKIKLLLEPLGPQEGNFLNTADQARALARLVGSPQIGLHLDVKAMSTEGIPIPEVIRRHCDWMEHFHCNDPNRQGPGMGEVDFRPILQTLKEVGYLGWLSVEVFDYDPGVERLVLESIANLRASA
jgi:sugar phosphate isomerase/epimerase